MCWQRILSTIVFLLVLCSICVGSEGNYLIVTPDCNLQGEYDWLKSSDRDANMGPLGANNRRTLILLPGKYELDDDTSWFTLDTDYVDVAGYASNPRDVVLYCDDPNLDIVMLLQVCNDVHLSNFAVVYDANHACRAFVIYCTSGDNEKSEYRNLYVSHNYIADPPSYSIMRMSLTSLSPLKGYWENCIAGDYAFRQDGGPTIGEMNATMLNCEAGNFSFGGDEAIGYGGNDMNGIYINCRGGYGSFGGCNYNGMNISGTLINCISGDRSFAIDKEFSGKAYSCHGGEYCFGGRGGVFSGYAQNCTAGKGSFGAWSDDYSYNSGALINCRMTGNDVSMKCRGARIEGCYIQTTAADVNCIILEDSNNVIYNSTILVEQGGTGIPIDDDGSARNVVVGHCRMNNASNDADGLGSNVTNLVSGYNIVDDDIK